MVLGVPPAKKTKMTAMPQLVALFNGVGGGTVALIAWAEFIETKGFSEFKPDQSPTVALVVGSLFAAIIGSVSFWGSLVAFAKLQESIPKNVEKKLVVRRQAVPGGQHRAADRRRRRGGVHRPRTRPGSPSWWIVLVLVLAGLMGLFVVFPIGGADMPVVISLLNAMTGLSAAAAGLGAQQHRDDRRRHDRRCVGFDSDQPDGRRDEPVHPRDRVRLVRRRRRRGRPGRR